MATSTTPRVDIGALSAELTSDVSRRVAELVVRTIDDLADDDRGLNQLQKIKLVQSALEDMGSFEATTARKLRDQLRREDVATWGLAGELAYLVEGDDA